MKTSILLSFILCAFSFFAFASPAQAQSVRYMSANQAWVVDEFPFNDYKLAFAIPNSRRWRVEATNSAAAAVLRTVQSQNGGIVNNDRGDGWRVIIVTAGGRARYGNAYLGSLNMWRNSIRVAYW